MPTAEPALLREIEGPKGKAQIYEVQDEGRTVYEVRHNGQSERYLAMGEAFIEAGQRVGTQL